MITDQDLIDEMQRRFPEDKNIPELIEKIRQQARQRVAKGDLKDILLALGSCSCAKLVSLFGSLFSPNKTESLRDKFNTLSKYNRVTDKWAMRDGDSACVHTECLNCHLELEFFLETGTFLSQYPSSGEQVEDNP